MHPSFKFQSNSAITLHPILFEESMFTYSYACQAEVAVSVESKLQSWNCRSYWNLKVSARMPRLESIFVSICKLQLLYFVTWILGDAFTVSGGNFAGHIYVKCPPKKTFLWPKWHLTGVEDFNIELWQALYEKFLIILIQQQHPPSNLLVRMASLAHFINCQYIWPLLSASHHSMSSGQFIIPCMHSWELKAVSGEIFGHNRSKSYCFLSPTGYMLWSFGFSLLTTGIP